MRYNPITLADIRRAKPKAPEKAVPIARSRDQILDDMSNNSNWHGSQDQSCRHGFHECPTCMPELTPSLPGEADMMLFVEMRDSYGDCLLRTLEAKRFKLVDGFFQNMDLIRDDFDATGMVSRICLTDDADFRGNIEPSMLSSVCAYTGHSVVLRVGSLKFPERRSMRETHERGGGDGASIDALGTAKWEAPEIVLDIGIADFAKTKAAFDKVAQQVAEAITAVESAPALPDGDPVLGSVERLTPACLESTLEWHCGKIMPASLESEWRWELQRFQNYTLDLKILESDRRLRDFRLTNDHAPIRSAELWRAALPRWNEVLTIIANHFGEKRSWARERVTFDGQTLQVGGIDGSDPQLELCSKLWGATSVPGLMLTIGPKEAASPSNPETKWAGIDYIIRDPDGTEAVRGYSADGCLPPLKAGQTATFTHVLKVAQT